MLRMLIAGVLAGLVLFVWGFVAHVMTPLGAAGMSTMTDDAPVVDALERHAGGDGLYPFPAFDFSGEMTEEEQQEWAERYRRGPIGIVIMRSAGDEPLSPARLAFHLLNVVLAGLVAAFLLAHTATGFGGRVFFVTALGLFGWLAMTLPYWNWYHFPFEFIAGEGLITLVGWFLAGLVMARLLPTGPR